MTKKKVKASERRRPTQKEGIKDSFEHIPTNFTLSFLEAEAHINPDEGG